MKEDIIWSDCSHNAFIGIYDDVISSSFCEELINYFDRNSGDYGEENIDEDFKQDPQNFYSNDGHGGSLFRRDYSINLESLQNTKWSDKINDVIFKCLDQYKKVFFVADQVEHLKLTNAYVKMQRTESRGGYHQWHCELNSVACVDRFLVWILYLNDIPEGEGETEFLWQGLRLQPKQGRLVIWPAGFTHTHRGNPVYSTTKYITTGWIEYADVRNNHEDSPVIFNKEKDFARSKKNCDIYDDDGLQAEQDSFVLASDLSIVDLKY